MRKICTIILISFSTIVGAQSLDEAFVNARNNFWNGQYSDAYTEFRRIAFFDTAGKFKVPVNTYLAEIHYHQKQYDEAIRFYNIAASTTGDIDLKNELCLKKAACYLRNRNTDFAISELKNIRDTNVFYTNFRINFMAGLAFFEDNELDLAFYYFRKCCNGDSLKIDKLISLHNKALKKKRKHRPQKSKVLSIFFPGLGQMYSGDTKDGLNALLINGGFAWLTVYTAYYHTVADALLSVYPWFFRYYRGNIENAIHKNNLRWYENKSKIYSEIVEILSQ